MATLSVVGTPIGNLDDITLRALKVLSSADVVLCEDTRVTKRLFDRHGIKAKAMSYHAHSKLSRTEEVISLLKEGKNIALVSDAGTPAISDPGGELVRHVRDSLADEILAGKIRIEAIPGPSALTAALSIAGVPCADFTFLGFLPHKKGRETLFREIAASKRTMAFYESPHRILKTLASLDLHLGTDNNDHKADSGKDDIGDAFADKRKKRVTVCRELTKVFEEVVSGTADEVMKYFQDNADRVRGEFVVIVREQ